MTAATATATACGDLKARMNGINGQRGIRDPQPAALVGRRPAIELRHAAEEAIAADREIVAELRRVHGSVSAIDAIERTRGSYAHLARALANARATDFKGGFRMQFRFIRLEIDQLGAACHIALR